MDKDALIEARFNYLFGLLSVFAGLKGVRFLCYGDGTWANPMTRCLDIIDEKGDLDQRRGEEQLRILGEFAHAIGLGWDEKNPRRFYMEGE